MPPFTPPAPGTTGLDVLVIGAGLALAWHLARTDLRFLVFDAAPEIGHAWRNRWDSLRLFTPSQHDGLPGMAFPASPDIYPGKDQVADYLADYAHTFNLPVLLNTPVTRLAADDDGFTAHTQQGLLRSRQVVVATGAFQTPVVPDTAGRFDPSLPQVHSAQYRNPSHLPAGTVLVVGAANSGLQIAEELATTHQVVVAAGTTPPYLPQRLLGRDVFWWLTRLGLMNKTAHSPLSRRVRSRGDVVIGSSRRRLRRAGVRFHPRLVSATGPTAQFDDGSSIHVDAVVWATGFRSDYSWIDIAGARCDGTVAHTRGVSPVAGLYFLGLPWQHTRGSSLLGFVQHDAAWLTDHITAHLPHSAATTSRR
ncbi:MAG: flavin-containing monooxygenase [Nocardioidaceae bacterium]